MATKATRYIDDQGRIVLPNHIRKALNLTSGNVVEVALEADNTIRIKPTEERCCVCGNSVTGKRFVEIAREKLLCYDCGKAVAKVMLK